MASSRTGTAKWKRIAAERLNTDRDHGLTNCPRCRTRLDWEYTRRPNSPEPDHIIPHTQGGQDTIENTRTICRRCNQQLGGQLKKRIRPVIETTELNTSPIW